ncbi:MAG: thermonuclease family protein [Chloroflexi bacterium]|nr:thermonuclease family protein [Chloroflexota bacterium]
MRLRLVRRWMLLVAGGIVCAVLGGGVVLFAGIGLAQDRGTEVRITAMRHDDGRVEFALQEREGTGWSDRILPRARFFPATGREGRWLISTPITVGVAEVHPVVTRVVDGDTIEVRMPDGELERVRLLLVDTPEVFGGVECYGREASGFVRMLLPAGTLVRLERDDTNRDSFGRLLRYLYLPDGSMLNERLIEGGYAEYNAYDGDNVRYATRIEAAEGRARAAGVGLWGVCHPEATSTPSPTPTATPEAASTPWPRATPEAAYTGPQPARTCGEFGWRVDRRTHPNLYAALDALGMRDGNSDGIMCNAERAYRGPDYPAQ